MVALQFHGLTNRYSATYLTCPICIARSSSEKLQSERHFPSVFSPQLDQPSDKAAGDIWGISKQAKLTLASARDVIGSDKVDLVVAQLDLSFPSLAQLGLRIAAASICFAP
jgi:hypothetical protein